MSAKPIALTSTLPASDINCVAHASPLRTTACVLASDTLILSLFFALAVIGRHVISPAYQVVAYLDLLPFLVMMLAGFWFQGLYPGVLIHPAEEMRRIFAAATTAFLIVACSAFLWRNVDTYSRSVLLITWAAAAPLVFLGRHFMRQTCKHCSWWGVSAVIIGSGTTAHRVARTLQDGRWGIRVAGILTDDNSIQPWSDELPPNLGPVKLASRLAKSHVSEYVILAMPEKSSGEIRTIIQSHCEGFRRVLLVPDMPGLCSLGIVARQMGTEIGFEVPQRLFQRIPASVKRGIDIVLSLLVILLLFPLFLLLSLCVRLSSPGNIFYGQARLGRNGGLFKALKFRTMVPGADKILTEYLATHPEHLFEWQRDHKLKRDPRITPLGRWMRRLSLDELPQLFNVLAGHMSLVGPRPIVDAEIEKYGQRYGLYSRVRPGITGLWQVSGRNNTTYEERVTLDEYYVHNWSVWLDTYILIRTLRTVVTTDGAY